MNKRMREVDNAYDRGREDGRAEGRIRIEALEASARSRTAAILGTIGGTVEGHPTSEINYLQRLRQLVRIEGHYLEMIASAEAAARARAR